MDSKGKLSEVGVNETVGRALKFMVANDRLAEQTRGREKRGSELRHEWISSRLYTVHRNTERLRMQYRDIKFMQHRKQTERAARSGVFRDGWSKGRANKNPEIMSFTRPTSTKRVLVPSLYFFSVNVTHVKSLQRHHWWERHYARK